MKGMYIFRNEKDASPSADVLAPACCVQCVSQGQGMERVATGEKNSNRVEMEGDLAVSGQSALKRRKGTRTKLGTCAFLVFQSMNDSIIYKG
jgi:hypothetical protein